MSSYEQTLYLSAARLFHLLCFCRMRFRTPAPVEGISSGSASFCRKKGKSANSFGADRFVFYGVFCNAPLLFLLRLSALLSLPVNSAPLVGADALIGPG